MPAVYTAIVLARPGAEDEVAALYRESGALLAAAPGFKGRHVLREQPGSYVAAAIEHVRAQGREVPQHQVDGHQHADAGVRFVSIEIWESAAQRVAYGLSPENQAHSARLTPLLLPEHSHELYQDILADAG